MFIKYGGVGYQDLFGTKTWNLEYTNTSGKQAMIRGICFSGVFEYIGDVYHDSWERMLSNLVTDKSIFMGLCNLFGMERELKKITRREVDIEEGMIILHKLVNKLSNVYIFNGDPMHPVSRRKMNDIRLNCLFKKKMFGREALTIAKSVSSFKDAINDPYIRTIFWSNYTPGTGLFSISVSNLEQLSDVDDCCSICLESFSIEVPGIKLHPCGHVFHATCIQDLILNMSSLDVHCPLCRSKVEEL